MKRLEALRDLGMVMKDVVVTPSEQEEVAKAMTGEMSIVGIKRLVDRLYNRFLEEEVAELADEDTDVQTWRKASKAFEEAVSAVKFAASFCREESKEDFFKNLLEAAEETEETDDDWDKIPF